MKSYYKISLCLLLWMVSKVCLAQSSNGHVTLLKKNAVTLYIGAGQFKPSADKNFTGIVKGNNFNFNLYAPLWYSSSSKVSMGLNLGGNYFSGNGDYQNLSNQYTVYNLKGQTQPPTVTTTTGGSPKESGYNAEGGFQTNFQLGRFSIAPIINGSYVSVSQKSLTVSEKLYYKEEYTYNLLVKNATKTTGFGLIPKIRFGFNFTPSIGIWVEGNYLLGPTTVTESSRLELNPKIPNGQYDLGDFKEGKYVTTTSSSKINAFGFNGGILINIGKKNKDKPTNSTTNLTESGQQIMNFEVPKEQYSPEIQKIMDEQDKAANSTFQYKEEKSNSKVSSYCNFNVEKVDIQCKGKDQSGQKRYSVSITYKNLSSTGIGSLGHYNVACTPTATNGTFVEEMPLGSATISSISPSFSVKTTIPNLGSQVLNFDLVPNTNFVSLHLKGNQIAGQCGNCDDIILLNLPNCCDGCETNKAVARPVSIIETDSRNGTIQITNSISSSTNIVKIDADLVAVKYLPITQECKNCNDKPKQQDNFIDSNSIEGSGWKNNGNPQFLGEHSVSKNSRSLKFESTSPSGINITSPKNIIHTIGLSPVSCCDEDVEVWIRYTLTDKDCKVCDKLVKSVISRKGSCNESKNPSNSIFDTK